MTPRDPTKVPFITVVAGILTLVLFGLGVGIWQATR